MDSTTMQKVLILPTCKKYWQHQHAGSIGSTNCRRCW